MKVIVRFLLISTLYLFFGFEIQAQCPTLKSVDVVDVSCFDGDDGVVTIAINDNGFAGNIKYTLAGIDEFGGFQYVTTGALTKTFNYTFTNLPASTTTYKIFIAFESPCSAIEASADVNEPAAATAIINITNSNPIDVCSEDDVVIDLDGSENGVTYEAFVNGTPTGDTTLGDGSPISITLKNINFVDEDEITVKARNGNCTTIIEGNKQPLKINVINSNLCD